MNSTPFPGRRHKWREWYARSCINRLQDNIEELGNHNVTIQNLKDRILAGKSEEEMIAKCKNKKRTLSE